MASAGTYVYDERSVVVQFFDLSTRAHVRSHHCEQGAHAHRRWFALYLAVLAGYPKPTWILHFSSLRAMAEAAACDAETGLAEIHKLHRRRQAA